MVWHRMREPTHVPDNVGIRHINMLKEGAKKKGANQAPS